MDNQNVWRDRLYPYDRVTREDFAVSTRHSVRTIDEVAKKGPFCLVICHMLTFYGEGFEALVKSTWGLKRCSDLHRGRDQAAYDKAKEEGVAILQELVAKLEHDQA